jgi:hypothetical protein
VIALAIIPEPASAPGTVAHVAQPAQVDAPAIVEPTPEATPPVVAPDKSASRAGATLKPQAVPVVQQPEVLIAADEARALDALIAAAYSGTIQPSPEITPPDVAMMTEMDPLDDIAIAPIVIAPLEGEHQ